MLMRWPETSVCWAQVAATVQVDAIQQDLDKECTADLFRLLGSDGTYSDYLFNVIVCKS